VSKDSKELLDDGPLYCEGCGKLMSREDLRESQCPTLCIDCCATIDRDTDRTLENDHFDWFGGDG
jgi:hypothetical protein